MRVRTLLDGTKVPEGDELPLSIRTRCPGKWLFVDLETGDVWHHRDGGFRQVTPDIWKTLKKLVKWSKFR